MDSNRFKEPMVEILFVFFKKDTLQLVLYRLICPYDVKRKTNKGKMCSSYVSITISEKRRKIYSFADRCNCSPVYVFILFKRKEKSFY